jgi:hypothetical protein
MAKHIKKYYPEITIEKALSKTQEAVKKQLRQLYHQAEATGKAEEFDLEILKASLNTIVLTEALISLIVVRNLSYTTVEWPEFHTFCQVLNQAYKGKITTSYSGVSNKVKEAWARYKDIIRKAVQSVLLRIYISLDIWTSPNRYLLLVICIHFTSYDSKRQKALLALKQVGSHSGENQFIVLLPVLQDYSII